MSGLAYPGGVPLGFRSRIEHAAYPVLERVNKAPRVVTLLLLVALVVVGLLAPRPFGGLAFVLVTAFVGALLYVTWPRLNLPERMMRVAVLVLVFAVAVVRTFPGSAG